MKKIFLLLLVLFTIPLVSANSFSDDFEDGNYDNWLSNNGATLSIDSSTPLNDTYSLRATQSAVGGGSGMKTNLSNYSISIISEPFVVDIQTECPNLAGSDVCRYGYDNDTDNSLIYYPVSYRETEGGWVFFNKTAQNEPLGITNRNVHLEFSFDNEMIYYLRINGVEHITNREKYQWNVTEVNYFIVNSGQSGINTDVEIDNINLGWGNDKSITITAEEIVSSTQINNFSSSIYYPNGTLLYNNSTISESISFNMTNKIMGNYTVNIVNDNYVGNKTTILEFLNNSIDYEFLLYKVPAVNISVFDEDNSLITENVSIIFYGDSSYYASSTTNGLFYDDENIIPDYYRIGFVSENYTSTNYFINLSSDDFATISVIMTSTDNTVNRTYTVKDTGGLPVVDALFTVLKRVDGVYTQVAQSKTDVAGKVRLQLTSGEEHKFFIEAEDYQTKIFTIYPVEDLTITLLSSTTVEYSTIFSTISYYYTPQDAVLSNSSFQTLQLVISSSSSDLEYWGISALGNTTNVTSQASGGIAQLNLDLSNLTESNFEADFFFKSVGNDPYHVIKQYYVQDFVSGNQTTDKVLDGFSFSTGGKLLLAVLIVVLLMLGVAYNGLPTIGVTIIGVGALGFFTYKGWVNEWLGLTIIVLTLIGIVISTRGDGS